MGTKIQLRNQVYFNEEEWEFEIRSEIIGKPYKSEDEPRYERVTASAVTKEGIYLTYTDCLPIERVI
ncbi:MAG: hypothetical protein KBG38_05420 [Candidatus Cloacimonas sp.]|nr:hypothetical protein [Candidatus Cloacimonas sp.]